MSPPSRNALIAGGVVLLHVAALWALQSGLVQRTVELVVPVELLAAMVTPPRAEPPAPPPPAPKPVELPVPKPIVPKVAPAPAPRPPAPRPVAVPDPTPSPTAPVGVTEPQPAPAPITTPVAEAPPPAPAPAAPPAPAAAKVEMPLSDADYLNNPAPVYPRMSVKLGEEGTTLVRVLIGPDGRAQKAQTAKSSGFARLDQAAESTTLSWRYVPGKRGGVPEAMWVNVPIKWELKN